MNIIYAYIEKYKALVKQEIKLSTFIEFTKKDNAIKICKSSIETDFYEKNIDIISLFGKNGSGKSTCIEAISLMLEAKHSDIGGYFVAFEDKEKIYYINKTEKEYRVECQDYQCIEIFTEDLNSFVRNAIFFSNNVDCINNRIKIKKSANFNYTDCSNQAYESTFGRKKFKIEQAKLTFKLLRNFNLESHNANNIPMVGVLNVRDEISAKIKKISLICLEIIERSSFHEREKHYADVFEILKKYNIGDIKEPTYKNLYTSLKSREKTENLSDELLLSRSKTVNIITSLQIIIDILTQYTQKEGLSNSTLLSVFLLTITNDIHDISPRKSLAKIQEIIDEDPKLYSINKENNLEYVQDYDLNHFANYMEEAIDDHWSLNKGITFHVESFEQFLGVSYLNESYPQLFESLLLRWNGISSGQSSLITLLSRIYPLLDCNGDIVIFLDEGEAFLHPEWQRRYISDLIKFFSTKSSNKKIKIVILSHCPFVLSDLLPNSVNFIGDKMPSKESFFGADIFQLYNAGFLLEMTLGEFSKNKIHKLISSIEDGSQVENSTTYKAIGNSFVKNIIKNKGNSKYDEH